MSGELLPAIRHLAQLGTTTVARAIVKGNSIKAEVVLYVARAHELPESWLGAAPPPAPVATVVPVVAGPSAETHTVAVVPGRPREHGIIPPAPVGIRFVVPPEWPQPPAGWVPPAGWRPDPSWPVAPDGWQWWVPVWGS
jgi:hypothetical protein